MFVQDPTLAGLYERDEVGVFFLVPLIATAAKGAKLAFAGKRLGKKAGKLKKGLKIKMPGGSSSSAAAPAAATPAAKTTAAKTTAAKTTAAKSTTATTAKMAKKSGAAKTKAPKSGVVIGNIYDW